MSCLCADNLERLYAFPPECVDLIYLDPPFFSNRRYDVIWGDDAEMRSFRDRWRGGILKYIDWVRLRAVELHRSAASSRRARTSWTSRCAPRRSRAWGVACETHQCSATSPPRGR